MSQITITILSLLISLVNVVFLYLIYKLVINKFATYDLKLSEFNIDNELQAAFSEHVENHDEINQVVNELFFKVKERYSIKNATSYSDLVEKLKNNSKIEKVLRESLIHFFEKIIIFSYKTDNISDQDKAELRKELKLILKRFQEDES